LRLIAQTSVAMLEMRAAIDNTGGESTTNIERLLFSMFVFRSQVGKLKIALEFAPFAKHLSVA
jgi:hypothetical protein